VLVVIELFSYPFAVSIPDGYFSVVALIDTIGWMGWIEATYIFVSTIIIENPLPWVIANPCSCLFMLVTSFVIV
jgi:hypothetical protein